MSIVDEIRKLNRSEITDPEHDCTAADVAGAICTLLGEIVLADEVEGDKLGDWEQGVRELRCTLLGDHQWEHDHCGYWGHKFCVGCHRFKYPELARLRCAEAIAKIGRIDEAEYLGANPPEGQEANAKR